MADITKTRAQLRERAAYELGKLRVGESLEQEDSDLIDGFIDPLIARWSLDGVVDIGDDEAIEVQYFDSIGKLLACACCGGMGGATALLVNNSAQSVGELIEREEARLRRLTAAPATYETLKATYY